jgi:myo-inositol-1(or 4)-monophosphatase
LHHPILNIAIKAARQAGHVIMRHLDRLDTLNIQVKGKNDFVSEVDQLAEREIIRVISAAYPDHAILAEESGAKSGNTYQWIIDPLDGTTNYLHGYPQFSVSIALERDGVLEQGVIFDPVRDELFTASRGRGAQLNNRRIRVSSVHKLEGCLLGTGFPFRAMDHLDPWLKMFRDMLLKTSGVRRAGSAALDLAYVACGRFDGFWELGLQRWDLAAGCLLIQEAGGLVSDLDNNQTHLASGNVVAANPYIHPLMLEIISRHHPF